MRACLKCFAAAEQAASRQELKSELEREETAFIEDVVRHLPDYDLNGPAKERLFEYLDRRRTLAQRGGRKSELDFIKATRDLAIHLGKQHPGYEKLMVGWLEKWFWWLRKPDATGTQPNVPGEDENAAEQLLDGDLELE